MRELTGHKVNPANDVLSVIAEDEPGSGGASHRYRISGFDTSTNTALAGVGIEPKSEAVILFQNGPINEVGVNGLTHEVLLAIVIDRMQAFQRGPYSSRENAIALTKLEEAPALASRPHPRAHGPSGRRHARHLTHRGGSAIAALNPE